MGRSVDCSDSLAAIEAYRQASIMEGNDITPRLIQWGLIAIARERPGANLGPWDSLDSLSRWRRVRMNLSAEAIISLHERLKKTWGAVPVQMELPLPDSKGLD